jgi:hypothetical protein
MQNNDSIINTRNAGHAYNSTPQDGRTHVLRKPTTVSDNDRFNVASYSVFCELPACVTRTTVLCLLYHSSLIPCTHAAGECTRTHIGKRKCSSDANKSRTPGRSATCSRHTRRTFSCDASFSLTTSLHPTLHRIRTKPRTVYAIRKNL